MFVVEEVATEFMPPPAGCCALEPRSSPERSPSKPLPSLPVGVGPTMEVEGIRGGAWVLCAMGGVGLFPAEREFVL